MILSLLALLAGLALLVWSSDKFVLGASATASSMGVSPLLIGLTIVGFGTSAPEMLVSAVSAWNGNPGLAIGNAIGSNIANIALILGASALIAPLIISSRILKHEMPLLVGVMLLALVLIIDKELSYTDGIILIGAMFLVMGWIIYEGITKRDPSLEEGFEEEIPRDIPLAKALRITFVGLVVLVGSSRLMVWGAVNIAESLGISDLIIGLSIVAIGTSLPELAASFVCMKKKAYDLALGNVLGSNLFNTLGVLGIAGIIQPSKVDDFVLIRDMPVQFALMLLLIYIAGQWAGAHGRISRRTGWIFLSCFVAYQSLLFYQSFA
jgi:cation:H+ antiporter